MNNLITILKKSANFELHENGHGYGAINRCPECKDMTLKEYDLHYQKCKQLLESLPWEKIVQNPYNPKADEYPKEDGLYITMMDCNEHEVCTNTFRDGHFIWRDRTHIKWWMPISYLLDEMRNKISALIMDTDEKNHLKTYIPLELSENQGLSTNDMLNIEEIWQNPIEGIIMVKLRGCKESEELETYKECIPQIYNYLKRREDESM